MKPQKRILVLVVWSLFFASCARDSGINLARLTRVDIVKQSFSVEPRGLKWWQFNASHGMRVMGRFEAQGGSGNDIRCVLLDQDSFANWRSGHSAKAFYDSGKTTIGNIDVQVPEGRYFLVFDNRFSVMSNKAVSAEIYGE